MKYFSRKRKPKRFYVLVGLFTAMTLTAWANFTYIDHKAELTSRAREAKMMMSIRCALVWRRVQA